MHQHGAVGATSESIEDLAKQGILRAADVGAA